MQIDIEKLNERLANPRKGNPVTEHNDNHLNGEERQGEYDTITRIYPIDGNYFLKVICHSDSYGYGEEIVSLKIVKPIQKTITEYV